MSIMVCRHDAAPQQRAAGGRGADLRPRAVRAVAEDARAAHGPGRVRRAQGHRAAQPRRQGAQEPAGRRRAAGEGESLTTLTYVK